MENQTVLKIFATIGGWAVVFLSFFLISKIDKYFTRRRNERRNQDWEKNRGKREQEEARREAVKLENYHKMVSELRAKLAAVSPDLENRPRKFPTDCCIFPYHGANLFTGEVDPEILDRLSHIKGCWYCQALLADQDRRAQNGLWQEVFRKEGASDANLNKLEDSR